LGFKNRTDRGPEIRIIVNDEDLTPYRAHFALLINNFIIIQGNVNSIHRNYNIKPVECQAAQRWEK
jgi:hypothetical protein